MILVYLSTRVMRECWDELRSAPFVGDTGILVHLSEKRVQG